MSINLTKGDGINLTKEVPGLTKVRVGLGWTPPENVDLDVSMFGLTAASGSPKLVSEDYFIFFNNKQTSDGSVKHLGDNRTGAGDGDDETIAVDLTKVNADVQELSFIVTIYSPSGYNFGKVKDAYIRIVNDVTGVEMAKYDLDAQFTDESAVQFGSMFRNPKGEWEFKAIGAGFVAKLEDFVAQYQ
jgi:tellurium resistance protein TerD